MNRNELVERLEADDGLLTDPVLIRTERQLLPNYKYDFEVSIEGGAVVLIPTTATTANDQG